MTYTTLVTPKELAEHLDDREWVIVDCRFSLADKEKGRRNYYKSHLPGAVYAHLDEDLSGPVIPRVTGRHPLPSVSKFVELLSQWGVKNLSQVVVYDDMSGAIASRLWWMMRWVGHKAIAVLDGGWQAWLEGGYPITTAQSLKCEEPRDSSVYIPNLRSELLVEANYVRRLRGEVAGRLIDSRSPDRHRGKVEPIDPIAGHIPGSINAPHTDAIGQDGPFRPPEDLKAHFVELLNNTPPEEAVFYCGSGVTAARNLLAMAHAGLGDGKLYAGSWSEWITHSSNDIVVKTGS
jgi:thiosulfate/3-mercaptopyruvate sulfurtransferase